MSKIYNAIGIMTGTSADGIDVAVIKTDGEKIISFGPTLALPFETGLHDLIKTVLRESQVLTADLQYNDKMLEAERRLTIATGKAVNELLTSNNLTSSEVDVIGFHGQTTVHRPLDPLSPAADQKPFTCQLGNGELLAQLSSIDVVYDFRSNDIKEGGQGAPFSPLYHNALVAWSDLEYPIAVVNIGGVANVSFLSSPHIEDIIAFDTGPGNGLIDDWVRLHTGENYDKDGQMAAGGLLQEKILAQMLNHPFFSLSLPKSLDRYDFDLAPLRGVNAEDGAATLTSFTARSIALAQSFLPVSPKNWIVCGGGRLNKTLMRELETALEHGKKTNVKSAEQVGWNGDHLEAQAFAYLAVRSLRNLPLSYPNTTGVSKPVKGGKLCKAGLI